MMQLIFISFTYNYHIGISMFTLNQKKPSKTPNKNPNDPQAGKKNKNSNNNKGSKKVNKTVFEDPFYYRMYCWHNSDSYYPMKTQQRLRRFY